MEGCCSLLRAKDYGHFLRVENDSADRTRSKSNGSWHCQMMNPHVPACAVQKEVEKLTVNCVWGMQ